MKKLCCLCIFVLLFMSDWGAIANDVIRDWGGVWQLNSTDGHFGGKMKISNCTNTKCDFAIQSWHKLHTCEVNGMLMLKAPNQGVYDSKKHMYDKFKDSEYFVPVGINFELLPDGNLNLEYKNPDSDSAFCGMSATVEGVWTKQKN